MNILRIEGCTRTLGAPSDWSEEHNGVCAGLPIRDVVTDDGNPWMQSAWEPSPDELERLKAGAPIILWINGVAHPVVSLQVSEAPSI